MPTAGDGAAMSSAAVAGSGPVVAAAGASGAGTAIRITSYNVCYTKLLR